MGGGSMSEVTVPVVHYLGDEPVTGQLTPEQMGRINRGFYRTYAQILARIARDGLTTDHADDARPQAG